MRYLLQATTGCSFVSNTSLEPVSLLFFVGFKEAFLLFILS